MAENFHDIIPPEERSIRNITSSHRKHRRPVSQERVENTMPPTTQPPQRKSRSFFSRFGVWIGALAAVLVLIVAFSLLFSGATVTVTPQQRSVLIDGTFEATQGAVPPALSYEVMQVDGELSATVSATGEETAEERASGQIVVFNDYSETQQRLITNTRFETPDGLIYRITQPVIVPGQREENGTLVPGSVEVTVYADEPGDQYNIGLTDFTIPGFQGSPQFESMYARSKTPMQGGFIGERLTADPSVVEQTRARLREQLEQDLREEALAQKTEGYYLFPGAVFALFQSLPSTDSGEQVQINERAVLYGVLFSESQLASFVAQNTIPGFENVPVRLSDISTLSFNVTDPETVRPWEADSFEFTLSGNTEVIWVFDAAQLKEDLSGRAKEALQTVLSGYQGIERAEVVLRPFWKQSFPEDPEKISVVEVLEE
jgi:hypothetical protein